MLKEQNKEAEINLLFANKTENEVLLYEELNEIKKTLNFNPKFFIEKFTNKKENNIDFSNLKLGLITKESLLPYQEYINDDETLVMLCGNKKMVNEYLKPMVLEMNFKKENIFAL